MKSDNKFNKIHKKEMIKHENNLQAKVKDLENKLKVLKSICDVFLSIASVPWIFVVWLKSANLTGEDTKPNANGLIAKQDIFVRQILIVFVVV